MNMPPPSLEIIAENQKLHNRLNAKNHENLMLKARIARLEKRYVTLYQKCVKAEDGRRHWFDLYCVYENKEINREIRINNIVVTLMPWRWELWYHIKNYVNSCLGRFSHDVGQV